MTNNHPKWWDCYYRSFKLGEYYFHRGTLVKFIQVTTKGFNMLNVKTNKFIFKNHFYCRDWIGKDMPEDFAVVKNVRVLTDFQFTVAKESKL